AKGYVEATVKGHTLPGNHVFNGMTPIEGSDGVYTNQISQEDGSFQLTRIYARNGSMTIAMTDLLGNRNKLPIVISGLDNTPPELVLNRRAIAVIQNKKNFDFRKDLGGFKVSDNVSKPEDVQVEISGLDLSILGEQQVTYIVTDQVGNQTMARQQVIVTDN